LETLVYWLVTLDVEFEVLEPPTLNALLQKSNERVARALKRSPSSVHVNDLRLGRRGG
jgi:hypothetical protein